MINRVVITYKHYSILKAYHVYQPIIEKYFYERTREHMGETNQPLRLLFLHASRRNGDTENLQYYDVLYSKYGYVKTKILNLRV